MTSARLLTGDASEVLRSLPESSARCCVTSPPYWGLRDYGMAGQLGLEKSPGEYVARMVEVFREVRRVLTDDGTLWLNIGDSYATQPGKGDNVPQTKWLANSYPVAAAHRSKDFVGIKPKDLVGIPWLLAFALRQPYYAGTIRNEMDRLWLAAMLDAEGCMFIHKRKAGQHNGQGYYRQNDSYGPGVEIANTSLAIIERVAALTGKGSICSQGPEQNDRRKQTIYRWNLRTIESRDFVRELYPYLVGKQRQARILYGCPSSGEQAERAHAALKLLHTGGETDVDFPAPPAMLEPGFYLRSDIIWSKCNPMPESVTDRPTKSHEYLFLLSKSARYYYDAAAIREPLTTDPRENYPARARVTGRGQQSFNGDGARAGDRDKSGGFPLRHSGNLKRDIPTADDGRGIPNDHLGRGVPWEDDGSGRNARSVWTIPTKPYSGAHFATFPEELARRCLVAGSAPGDTVLDPFSGSGTTAAVAIGCGRKAIGIELNPKYQEIARHRIGPMLCEVA